MRFLRKALVVVALVAGSLAAVTLPAAGPVLASTDCSQTAYLGDRMCLDLTTGYGPLVQIFTPGGTFWNAFPVVPQVPFFVGTFSNSHANWTAVGQGVSVGAIDPNGNPTNLWVGNYCCNTNIAATQNATYVSWLQWFGNGAAYPTMEFVVAT